MQHHNMYPARANKRGNAFRTGSLGIVTDREELFDVVERY
jgi:hypothetical protein